MLPIRTSIELSLIISTATKSMALNGLIPTEHPPAAIGQSAHRFLGVRRLNPLPQARPKQPDHQNWRISKNVRSVTNLAGGLALNRQRAADRNGDEMPILRNNASAPRKTNSGFPQDAIQVFCGALQRHEQPCSPRISLFCGIELASPILRQHDKRRL